MSSLLKKEIKQRAPFTSDEEEAFLNLQRTGNVLVQELSKFFKEEGLTPTQYNALRILRGAHPASLPCREVGVRMVTPVPDVTRLMDRLESARLVKRNRDKVDRRVVNVRITETGLQLLERLQEPVENWLVGRLGHLDSEDLQSLSRLLERLRQPPGID